MYHEQWSQKYYGESIPDVFHDINNKWFGMMTSFLKEDGVLYVPDLGKSFNKQGEEVNA